MSLPTWLIDRLVETYDQERLYWLHSLLQDLDTYLLKDVDLITQEIQDGQNVHRCTVCQIGQVQATIRDFKMKVSHALQAQQRDEADSLQGFFRDGIDRSSPIKD